MMLRNRGQVLLFGLASLLLASCTNAHNEGHVKFGYTGAIGPNKWGSLHPDYHLCSDGKQQSPINIVKENAKRDPALEPLKSDYMSTNATLVNNGFNIGLGFDESAGTIHVQGKNFSLVQIHWHSPAEHTIEGVRHPLELHVVHKSEEGDFAVVSILYQYGKADPFLLQLNSKIDELAKDLCSEDEEANVAVDFVNVKALKRASRKYYRYVGSLSTPPCSENVTWTILGKVREVSKIQVAALKKPLTDEYKNNSRPTQPLNGRTVSLYNEAEDN